MTNAVHYINSLVKEALTFSDEEWDAIAKGLPVDTFIKICPMVASVKLLRDSLDFTKEAEQIAEEVTA